jgi:restriction system protein
LVAEPAQKAGSGDTDKWKSAVRAVNLEQERARQMFAAAKSACDIEKAAFEVAQAQTNAKLEAFRVSYMSGSGKAVAQYCDMLLSSSNYPDFIELEFSVGFNDSNGMAVIECELPDKDAVPTLQKVTFIASSQ